MFQFRKGSAPLRWRLALPFAILASLLCVSEASAQRAVLSHAMAPVKLIRKTRMFDARAGTTLYAGDLVGTENDSAQFELPSGTLVALGAGTTVMIDMGVAKTTLTLLRGWIKVKRAPRSGTLSVTAGALTASPLDSCILHVSGDLTEAFAESGAMAVAPMDKAQGSPFALAHEQYVAYRPAHPSHALPGAPQSFVTTMPHAYFDPLIALAARVKPAEPALRREVDVTDIAAWNDVPAAVREKLAQQFAPRLSDPAFRAAATTVLGKQPEWRQFLRDATPRRKPAAMMNHLF
jgi:hypothetical protein